MEYKQLVWTILQITGALGGITSFIALMLGPMFYLGAKIDNLREEMHKESKDFHKRLCEIEAKRSK